MRVLVSSLILMNLLIGSSLAGPGGQCQQLDLTGFEATLNGRYSKVKGPGRVYQKEEGEELYLYRGPKPKKGKKAPKYYIARNSNIDEGTILMERRGRKSEPGKRGGVTCGPDDGEFKCDFKSKDLAVAVTGHEEVSCVGPNQPDGGRRFGRKPKPNRRPIKKPRPQLKGKTDASAMMEGDAVAEQSASGLSSGDFMMMAAGAAVGALLVAVAVAVVVAMRKRKSAKRTEMEMTEAVHVPDTSVMTPDATEKKAEGDEEAVTVHSSHAAEVTVSVSMDDEAVQVDA